ncbi:MAG: hypothetical protein AAGF46_00985 [Pseudomonadota bacterium]
MHNDTEDWIMRNSVFAWMIPAICVLLLIPFVAMQLTTAVDWTVGDFLVMGVLLFTAGSAFVLVARRVPPGRKILVGVLVAVAFLYTWAELAVGIFTDWGS